MQDSVAQFEVLYGMKPEEVRNIAEAMGIHMEEFQMTPGTPMLDLPLESGGSLQVVSHPAIREESEEEGAPPPAQGWSQEWRVLRFRPDSGTSLVLQSVTKVQVAPWFHPPPRERLLWEVLTFAYTRALPAVAITALELLGAPVIPSSETHAVRSCSSLRFLCIGLGGGSVPAFLASFLPHCHVDVVELEPVVVKAATEAMGFQEGPRLRVVVADGVEFAARAAESDRDDVAYDAVLVDAYDAMGRVPEPLRSPEGGLARALRRGLLRRRGGVVATNFIAGSDVAATLAGQRSALTGRGTCVGFTVQAAGGVASNRIAVQMCSEGPGVPSEAGDLRRKLEASGRRVDHALDCPLDLAAEATRSLSLWEERASLAAHGR